MRGLPARSNNESYLKVGELDCHPSGFMCLGPHHYAQGAIMRLYVVQKMIWQQPHHDFRIPRLHHPTRLAVPALREPRQKERRVTGTKSPQTRCCQFSTVTLSTSGPSLHFYDRTSFGNVTFGTGTGKFVAFVGHLGTIGAVQTLTNGDVKLINRSTGLIFFWLCSPHTVRLDPRHHPKTSGFD